VSELRQGLLRVWIGILAASSLASCSTQKVINKGPQAAPIEEYCPYLPAGRGFSSSVTVTGSAQYQFRTNGNGIVNPVTRPIRYAEVSVRNALGSVIQCTETDASGQFSLSLPAGSGDYTLSVRARANNQYLKAYVMDDPMKNLDHRVSTTVSSTGNSNVSLVASATGSLEGGAFHILDRIFEANHFLRQYASSAACGTFTDCPAFSVAPLAYVYWKPGFNPATYLNPSATSGVSFYLKGTNELYILGGINGDVNFSDCDHFDDSIILHEYGHFIENYYAVSDSPGGRHAPNDTLDPRLAFSEAWANFFQAAVTGIPLYRDTEGNESCNPGNPTTCTGAFHDEDLETAEDYDTDVVQSGFEVGRGNFREFSISRILWDGLDPHPVSGRGGLSDPGRDLDNVQSTFAEIWTVFAGPTNGLRSSLRFRSMGLFHQIQQTLTAQGGQDWSGLRTAEKQLGNRKDYAATLSLGGSCSAITIQAKAKTDGSFSASDQFSDNDFYAYYHSGGPLTVRVNYAPNPTSATNPSDVDLIVWKDGYTYGDTADIAASSRRSRTTDGGVEQISTSLAAGWYMINIMVNPVATIAGGGAPNVYTLTVNGQSACPSF